MAGSLSGHHGLQHVRHRSAAGLKGARADARPIPCGWRGLMDITRTSIATGITRTSIATGITRTRDIPVTQEQLERWQQGGLIPDVMPELPAEDREFVQSGMTQAEWEELGVE